ncbi:MAG: autotransporter domain-containing protein [Planctomycetia bacterium]|nr:autotransporter domain-containing protein [Planctomycetia bacterium]
MGQFARGVFVWSLAAGLLIVALGREPLNGADYQVTVATDDGTGGTTGTLSWAINQSNTAGGTNSITVDHSVTSISMSGSLPMISSNVTIAGNSATLQGNDNRLFFVNSGTVSIQNLAVTGGKAQGGLGGNSVFSGGAGGGGLGAGGGLFVNSGASVSIQNVSFSGNSAVGGGGGSLVQPGGRHSSASGGGGGGGFGGAGGGVFNTSGGGGGGYQTAGGTGGTYGGAGGGGLVGSGGNGGFQIGGTGSGGTAGGSVGQPGANGTTSAPGGGGGGDGSGTGYGGNGATFGGGGGGGYFAAGGNGGDFGGGGGSNYESSAGNGGFGGGGGGGGGLGGTGGAGGFGAGNGGNGSPVTYTNGNGGGGGSGYGGAIFVRDGGSLTVIGSTAASNNGVAAGTGGTGDSNGASGSNGQAAGSNLYLMSSVNAVFDGTGTTTFAGTISGNGSVIKQGTGTLVLSGANTYGHTEVNGGTLSVNGTILGDTTVGADGTLGGNGVIYGSVQSDGVVAPGNSIGTLNIAGNYNPSHTALTRIEINANGNTPGVNNDVLVVQGTANLNGSVDVRAAAGSYTNGTQYTFLTAASGISGTFDSVTDDLAGFHFQLSYEDYAVLLTLLRDTTDYAAFAETINQFGSASYIDFNSANGDLQGLIDQLNALSPNQLRQALSQLTPESVGTIAQLGVQNTTFLNLQLSRQLRPGGGNVSEVPDGDDDVAAARGLSREAKVFLASFSNSGDAGPVIVRGQDGGSMYDWTAWTTGYGMGGAGQSDGNAAGGSYGLGGVLVAAQRNIDEDHLLGIYGAYTGFSLNTDGPQQSETANAGQLGSYFRGGDGFNYYLLAASLGPDSYKSARAISIGNITGTAEGSYGGWQSNIWLERGVTINRYGWNIQPLAALNYVFLQQSAHTEHGSGITDLDVDSADTNALRGLVGGYVSHSLNSRLGHALSVDVRAFWMHEFLEPETTVNSSFAAIGGLTFAANGLNFGRDWAILGAGVKWDLTSQLALLANYDLQINARQSANYGTGGLQYSW